MTRKVKAEWVVAGGKIGEMAHCTRCGEGLEFGGAQRLPIVVAVMKAFTDMHKNCKQGAFKEPETTSPGQWFHGRDTGTSSLTIYGVIMNTQSPHGRYDVPHDPDDFGRCYRLLKLFPDWRKRLPDVAARFPEWKPFVREWDRLTAMYETAINTKAKSAPEMYELMKALEREGKAQPHHKEREEQG